MGRALDCCELVLPVTLKTKFTLASLVGGAPSVQFTNSWTRCMVAFRWLHKVAAVEIAV